ncbi:hypothetical protein [Iodobacter ciconiae]|uniref:N-acetyltransferase domain-containing protein n=1 Tax=Iodobacter ciconiae TaxID=2496266 RepID=A0A3S8ZV26_9NEIS|nr:hypothetical protein [Iodobacter ciconiae]AZN37306.1 hypothetical protein EJO50_12905 [Iodobacter ciconiae]
MTWITVTCDSLSSIDIIGTARFWPKDIKGAALFIFETKTELSAEELKNNKITASGVGYYTYLKDPSENNEFNQQINFPKGKLNRIGIKLWNTKEEILFEKIEFKVPHGSLSSEHELKSIYIDMNSKILINEFTKYRHGTAFNLLNNKKTCTPKCHAISSHWYSTMDDYALRHINSDVKRTNCYLRLNKQGDIPLTVYHAKPAILKIPPNIEAYLYEIGDKSRNMIKKAVKSGYAYIDVNPDDFIDDVIKIRTSDTLRQGQEIPEYFYRRPESVLSFKSSCDLHGESFFGIFKNNELVAYSTIFLYGELAQVNHILGHKDHLQNGIMNLLVFEMVQNIIKSKPWIKGVNYLYVGNPQKGIGIFKKSMGFKEEAIVTTQSAQDVSCYFENNNKLPENTTKLPMKIKVKKPTPELVLLDNSEVIILEKEAHKFTKNSLSISEGITINTIYYDVISESFINGANTANDFNTVIIKNLTLEKYTDFLSHGIKNLSEKMTKNSFVICDFITNLENPQNKNIILNFLNETLKNKDNELIKNIIDYISRRFRSLDTASIRNGFKSGDYAVKGIINYQKNIDKFGFDSLIVLKKIH